MYATLDRNNHRVINTRSYVCRNKSVEIDLVKKFSELNTPSTTNSARHYETKKNSVKPFDDNKRSYQKAFKLLKRTAS